MIVLCVTTAGGGRTPSTSPSCRMTAPIPWRTASRWPSTSGTRRNKVSSSACYVVTAAAAVAAWRQLVHHLSLTHGRGCYRGGCRGGIDELPLLPPLQPTVHTAPPARRHRKQGAFPSVAGYGTRLPLPAHERATVLFTLCSAAASQANKSWFAIGARGNSDQMMMMLPRSSQCVSSPTSGRRKPRALLADPANRVVGALLTRCLARCLGADAVFRCHGPHAKSFGGCSLCSITRKAPRNVGQDATPAAAITAVAAATVPPPYRRRHRPPLLHRRRYAARWLMLWVHVARGRRQLRLSHHRC